MGMSSTRNGQTILALFLILSGPMQPIPKRASPSPSLQPQRRQQCEFQMLSLKTSHTGCCAILKNAYFSVQLEKSIPSLLATEVGTFTPDFVSPFLLIYLFVYSLFAYILIYGSTNTINTTKTNFPQKQNKTTTFSFNKTKQTQNFTIIIHHQFHFGNFQQV